MRVALAIAALATLILIGTVEATVSNGLLADLPGRARPAITGAGTALTLLSAGASAVVYAALGLGLARVGAGERSAVGVATLVGLGAGLIGGAIRALLVADYLRTILADYGMEPLLGVVLGTFVVASVLVSVAAGPMVAWLSFRRSRRRVTSSPPS